MKKVKWIKRANGWAVIEGTTDLKTGKSKQSITWHSEEPDLSESKEAG